MEPDLVSYVASLTRSPLPLRALKPARAFDGEADPPEPDDDAPDDKGEGEGEGKKPKAKAKKPDDDDGDPPEPDDDEEDDDDSTDAEALKAKNERLRQRVKTLSRENERRRKGQKKLEGSLDTLTQRLDDLEADNVIANLRGSLMPLLSTGNEEEDGKRFDAAMKLVDAEAHFDKDGSFKRDDFWKEYSYLLEPKRTRIPTGSGVAGGNPSKVSTALERFNKQRNTRSYLDKPIKKES